MDFLETRISNFDRSNMDRNSRSNIPAWFSIGVVLVTGTSKGIGVSLGSEGNLYFCAGVVILVLGLVIFTISFRVIIRYFRKLKKGLSFVPIILFGVCSFCTIAFTVGIVEYFTEIAKCFTYAISVYWQNDF